MDALSNCRRTRSKQRLNSQSETEERDWKNYRMIVAPKKRKEQAREKRHGVRKYTVKGGEKALLFFKSEHSLAHIKRQRGGGGVWKQNVIKRKFIAQCGREEGSGLRRNQEVFGAGGSGKWVEEPEL